ncbi:hypothetical protein ABIA69_001027 [Lysinibacillus parviboronicapiens]|uniref:Uncharacterized protein n=1 Tax=Lysinibacillus parviboronicapiens TaxID=436516 RepID=A0ABV2PGE8_9BACI
MNSLPVENTLASGDGKLFVRFIVLFKCKKTEKYVSRA